MQRHKHDSRPTSRFLLTAYCLLLTVFLVPATHGQTTQPANTAQDFQGVIARQASLVTEFEINRLKVLVKRREGSQTVAAALFIRGGAENINASNAGIESFMLSAASEASVAYPRERMRKELSRMGTVISDSSTYDYSVLSMKSTRANFDHSWDIFTDVAVHPLFTKMDFTLVQARIVAGLREAADEPDAYLQRLQEQVAYVGHPYLNRPDGTPENISRLSLEDLRAYHQKMMQTSRLLLVIVGDLDAAQLKPRITAAFGKLPRGDYKLEAPPQLTFSSSTVDVTSRNLPTNYIQGLFTAPPDTSPDIYPMRVASSMLRDRVFEEVRVKRNLSYAPDAFLRSQSANIGGIYVTAVDANQAVGVMLNEISLIQRGLAHNIDPRTHQPVLVPIDQDDITAVVAQYLTGYYMSQETNAAQAAELGQYELVGGGWRNSLVFLEKLRNVTPADVQRVAQKYMRNIRFVVLGNPTNIDKTVFTGQAGG